MLAFHQGPTRPEVNYSEISFAIQIIQYEHPIQQSASYYTPGSCAGYNDVHPQNYSGHGTLKMNKSGWGNTEIIKANHYVGVDLPSGKPTIKIHYGRKGAHIIPILRGGRGEQHAEP